MSGFSLIYPCNMSLAYLGDSWQDHCDRPGYLAQGWEPGIDILSRGQAKIDLVAVLGGRVTRDKDNGYNMGFGTYCEIDHGLQTDGHRYKSLYAHMDGNIVKVGQVVQPGQAIGVMGSSGNSDVVHVHFILWRDGKNVDPMPFLSNQAAPPTPTEPPEPVQPPVLGDMVKIGEEYELVGLRTAPDVDSSNLIRRIDGKDSELRFQRRGEIPANGRTWTEVICYIASDYLEAWNG